MSLPNPLYGLVLEEALRPTRNGDRYFLQYTLRTSSGQIKANMWNALPTSDKDPSFPHKGDIVEIIDLLDQLETHKSIVINHFKRIDKESLPEKERSICEFPKADPLQIKKAFAVIGNKNFYENEQHYKFVEKCFSKLDRNLLLACPAATKIHHSMAGGLIIHTAEVMKIARAIYSMTVEDYPFLSNDVLMVGAAMHDIGKVRTYFIDELGVPEKAVFENTIGHMYYGIELIQSVGQEMGLDASFLNEVAHCIASHHGKVEFGSIKPIQSQEALILHCADLISSRNGMIENKLQEVVRTNYVLPDSFNIYSDPYFASIGMHKFIKSHS